MDLLAHDHGVHGSWSSWRKVRKSLRGGMAPHREGCQVDPVGKWMAQARASKGRLRPTLSVGRAGIFVPLRHGVAQEGATATVSGLERRGRRVGTVSLGQMPEAGQGTLTEQLSALWRKILSRVDSQDGRLAYVPAAGYHPSTYAHEGRNTMTDPRRPWRRLEGMRLVDFSHACPYMQQLAEAIFGSGGEAQRWAKARREGRKSKTDGVARGLKSASALRRRRGVLGTVKAYAQASGYRKKRRQWRRYQAYRRQK